VDFNPLQGSGSEVASFTYTSYRHQTYVNKKYTLEVSQQQTKQICQYNIFLTSSTF